MASTNLKKFVEGLNSGVPAAKQGVGGIAAKLVKAKPTTAWSGKNPAVSHASKSNQGASPRWSSRLAGMKTRVKAARPATRRKKVTVGQAYDEKYGRRPR